MTTASNYEYNPDNYLQELTYTQSIRRGIVDTTIAAGQLDQEGLNIILRTLKDYDQVTLTDRKNRIDEKGSQSAADVAYALAEIVKLQSNKNPFMREADGSIPNVDESKLGEHDIVDGEGDIGNIQETSEVFFKRMGMDKKTN